MLLGDTGKSALLDFEPNPFWQRYARKLFLVKFP